MRIRILGAAESDLLRGFHFYESRSPGLGTYFLDSLYSDIDSLAYFAGIHPIVFGYHRQLARRFPFAIYYRVAGEEALVSAVLDCRRDPGRIKKKLSREH